LGIRGAVAGVGGHRRGYRNQEQRTCGGRGKSEDSKDDFKQMISGHKRLVNKR